MSNTLPDRAAADTDLPEVAPGEGAARPPSHPRVGVVLAAGHSQRLAGVTGGNSKVLIRVGGLSLVGRAIRTLLVGGVDQVVVVVGFQAGPVAAHVRRLEPRRVRAVYADAWEQGNGASLAAAAPYMDEEGLFVLLTADHVFGEGALDQLLSSNFPGVLVDHSPGPAAWAEGTRVRLRGKRVVAFSKGLDDPSIDCGAFLLPAAIFDAQRRAHARGDPSLAGAVTELARESPLAAVPLAQGSWWQDVDTSEDLRRARALLRRSLTKDSDGPVSRYLNRPLSTRLSMDLAPFPIHPDFVSFVAFLTGIAGALLLAAGMGIGAAILVHLTSLLDGVDGELARLQVRTSAGGALLDGLLDRLADAAILAGVAVWALDRGADPVTIAVLAVAATAGAMLSMATKDRILALGLPPTPERWIGFLLGGRDARLLFVAIGALLGRPLSVLIAIIVTSAASLAVRLLLTRRALRAARTGPR